VALSRRNGRSRATLVFLILLSVTVITLDFRGEGDGMITTLRNGAGAVLAPVRDVADTALSPVGDALAGLTGYGRLEDENDRLRAELDEARGLQLQEQDALAELRELRNLLDLEWVGDLPTVAARVVAAPVSNYAETVELNRGTDHGVAVDMPVVTGAGLVGRVVQASPQRSIVRLITDPASSVGVRLVRDGEIAIAEGEGPNRPLSVSFVEMTADVRVRGLAVTSGLEGGSDVYPPNIPVGRVVRAEKPPGQLEQDVDLEPVADLRHLRYVKVVLTQPAGQP
jgi:rod shape-determining protein MreC